MLKLDEFIRYGAEGFTLAPLWRRLKSTRLTPLAVYRRLANRGNDYLFETGSFNNGQFVPSFSYVGLPCDERIELTDECVREFRGSTVVREKITIDPLAELQSWLKKNNVPLFNELPPYSGGLFGYFGYETVRMIEQRLARMSRKPSLVEIPDAVQLISKEMVIFDHSCGEIIYLVHAVPDSEQSYLHALYRLDEIETALKFPQTTASQAANDEEIVIADNKKFEFHFPQKSYEAAVEKIKEYIKAGEVMQVVLSQGMTCSLSAEATDYYHEITKINPSPYSYILNFGNFQIVGTSPEMLVRSDHGAVVSRPMAGTRRRGTTTKEDIALRVELLSDPKEIAEHVMLVDLARNDIGRLARVGSVTIGEKMVVEKFSHVMHIVSTIKGELPAHIDSIDVLKSTFPAGTLSGASKIRAIEVINELEPHSRGVYGGAIGYLNWHKNMDLAITIRTGVICEGMLHLQAGAGIVMDSCPEREWKETIEKSRVVVDAVTSAEQFGHRRRRQVKQRGRDMHLLIDNYDSFTYNVVQYLGMLGIEVNVRRNDEIDLADIEIMAPKSLIISPGPSSPNEAGISIAAIRHFSDRLPILGICLGHQCIAAALGGRVRRADSVFHGKVSRIRHNADGIFQDIPQGVAVARYHSLVVDDLPSCLEITAREEITDGGEGEIMAIAHREYPIVGVQFHPESILTDYGLKMLDNFFLHTCRDHVIPFNDRHSYVVNRSYDTLI